MADINDAAWAVLREHAARIATVHGTEVGAGVPIDDDQTARRWLDGIADDDPAVLEMMPDAPLSGTYANDYTRDDLYRELGIKPGDDTDDLELSRAYEDAYRLALQREVEQRALCQLTGQAAPCAV